MALRGYRSEQNIMPSLLDRLFDDDPRSAVENPDQRFQNLKELKASVARDVQALLNTVRIGFETLAPEVKETPRSLAMYGLSDLSALSLENPDHHEDVRRAIEEVIGTFEMRLKEVRVSLEPTSDFSRTLRFRVDSLLQVPPVSEAVVFNAALELNHLEYKVEEKA